MTNLAECTFLSLANRMHSFLSPPPPQQTCLRGSLKEPAALFSGVGLFDWAKMVLAVLHKKLDCKVDKPKYKKLEVI